MKQVMSTSNWLIFCGVNCLFHLVDGPHISDCACPVTEERCNEVESLVFDLFANLGASGAGIWFHK